MRTKKCRICESIKPISCFHKSTRTKDGHSIYCKKCRSERTKEYRRKNPEQCKAYAKAYYLIHPGANKGTPEQNRSNFRKWLAKPINKILHEERRNPIDARIKNFEARLARSLEINNSATADTSRKRLKKLYEIKAYRTRVLDKLAADKKIKEGK